MQQDLGEDIRLSPGRLECVYELFHENSKLTKCSRALGDQKVLNTLPLLEESLPYVGYPAITLPNDLIGLTIPLKEAILSRASAFGLRPTPLTLQYLATLLHCAYGITRTNESTPFPKPFRSVPSAGALYPLELFCYTDQVHSIKHGLYHFNPVQNCIKLIRSCDDKTRLMQAVTQPHIIGGASLVIFITAMFERSVFKYGDRGYRFILLEAGHLAQNINLVAQGLSTGVMNIGGYFDQVVDDFLGIDGVKHSTVYMVAIGGKDQSSLPKIP